MTESVKVFVKGVRKDVRTGVHKCIERIRAWTNIQIINRKYLNHENMKMYAQIYEWTSNIYIYKIVYVYIYLFLYIINIYCYLLIFILYIYLYRYINEKIYEYEYI